MNENIDSSNSDSEIVLQLTAYLDGELPADEMNQVEERIATDEKYRGLMQEMQQTWDVLDVLPSASAKNSFTQSTMKMVVEDAAKLVGKKKNRWLKWPLRFLVMSLILAAGGAGAFLMARHAQDEPNRLLAKDFAVIRDFDVFDCDPNISVELLSALAEEPGIFGGKKLPADQERYASFHSEVTGIDTLAEMDSVQKERVRANRADFLRLEAESRQVVRGLHAEVEASQNRKDFRDALYSYRSWLGSLGETDKSKVLDAGSVDEKIKLIKSLVGERYLYDFAKQMPREDLNSVYLALMDLLGKRAEEIQETFVGLFGVRDDVELQILAGAYRGMDKEIFLGGARLKDIFRERPEMIEQVITDGDLELITGKLLSESGKLVFDGAVVWPRSVESRAHLLASWLVTAYDEKFSPESTDLQEFFTTLPSDVQDSLNNEFPADRKRRLLEMWEDTFKTSVN